MNTGTSAESGSYAQTQHHPRREQGADGRGHRGQYGTPTAKMTAAAIMSLRPPEPSDSGPDPRAPSMAPIMIALTTSPSFNRRQVEIAVMNAPRP